MQNIRIQRMNNLFMKELGEILLVEVKNPVLKGVVLTGVNITNDLSYAKIYFTCFDTDNELVLKELKESSGFLRNELAKRIDIRHTPELIFEYDDSVAYAKKIEDKIKEIKDK